MKNSEFAAKKSSPSEGKTQKNTPDHAFLRIKHPMKYAYARFIGILGILICASGACFLIGFGRNIFFVLYPWITVFGLSFFALFATYRLEAVQFLGDSVLSFFCERQCNERYINISQSWRCYVRGAAMFGFILGLASAMGPRIDRPIVEFGAQISLSLMSLAIGIIVSEIIIPILQRTYCEDYEVVRRKDLLIILFGFIVLAIIICFPAFFDIADRCFSGPPVMLNPDK